MSTIGQKVALEFAKSPKGKALKLMEDRVRSCEIELKLRLQEWSPETMIDFLNSITGPEEKGSRGKKALLILILKARLDRFQAKISEKVLQSL